MLIKTLRLVVHCEYETLWSLLLDRLENPEGFFPEVTGFRVVEQQGNVSLREMKLHGELVREKVTVRPYEGEILHELLEHPTFTGTILAKVVKTARQSPVAPQELAYDIDIIPRSRLIKGVLYGEAEIVEELEAQMHHLKQRAEELEKKAQDH